MNQPLTQEMIDEKVAQVRRRQPAYGEMVAWLGKLLGHTLQQEAQVHLPALCLSAGQLGPDLAAGKPLFPAQEIPLDLAHARQLYLRLVQEVEARKASRELAPGLLRAWPEEAAAPPALRAALAGDRAALMAAGQELGVPPDVLYMLMCLAVRPSLRALAQVVLPQVDLEHWNQGHCPLCGSLPKLADLSGEGGRRRLHCALCESDWFFRRLRCPFCQNEEAETLEVLTAGDEEGYRVDLCLRCGQHLKTLDLRVLAGPVILWLDDLATWHLDIVAERRLEETVGQRRARQAS